MRHKMRLLLLVLVLGGLAWSQTASAALVSRKISGVMPAFGDVVIADPAAPQFSRNSTYMVYVADQRIDATFELFRAPVFMSGTPSLLGVALSAGNTVDAFSMASNRQELVYRVSTPAPDATHLLYRVAVSSPPSVQLGGPPITGDVIDFKLSQDSGRVVFRVRNGADDELYRTPMGGGPAIRLSGDNVRAYKITPNSQQVVFKAYLDDDEDPALLSVPIDGGAVVRVGNNSPVLYSVSDTFFVSPDSQYVVFFGQSTILGPDNIFSAPITGGAATRLNAPLSGSGGVAHQAAISPDSTLVVFKADQEGDGTYDLYTVPLTGGAPVKVSNLPAADRRVEDDFRFTPDSSYVLYRADQQTDEYVELFKVPVSGGAATVLSGGLPTGRGVKQFELTPDGGTVVFLAEHIWSYNDHLYSTPLAGGVAPIDLLTTMGDAGDADAFALDAEGTFVAFIGHWGSDAPRSLYAVQVDGSALRRLSADLEDDRSVDGFWVAPVGAAVAYGADVEVSGRMELYVAYDETKLFLPVVKR